LVAQYGFRRKGPAGFPRSKAGREFQVDQSQENTRPQARLPLDISSLGSRSNSGHAVSDHFVPINEMVGIGSDAHRELEDWALSRDACYLVIRRITWAAWRMRSISREANKGNEEMAASSLPNLLRWGKLFCQAIPSPVLPQCLAARQEPRPTCVWISQQGVRVRWVNQAAGRRWLAVIAGAGK